MIKAVSGLEEISFHMSGTEAVMAAVRKPVTLCNRACNAM